MCATLKSNCLLKTLMKGNHLYFDCLLVSPESCRSARLIRRGNTDPSASKTFGHDRNVNLVTGSFASAMRLQSLDLNSEDIERKIG